MQAILALEDGRIFRGESHGAAVSAAGEVVFNTSLTGYQEIFTDPSYAGQIVVLTNPQIGNYGTNAADTEAQKPYIEGLVTREFSPVSSNWRSEQVADEYLERHGVPVISEIDTRALVRHLRTYGVDARRDFDDGDRAPKRWWRRPRPCRRWTACDLASVVIDQGNVRMGDREHRTANAVLGLMPEAPADDLHVVAYDYGIKHNILRMLTSEGCRVTVVPAQTPAEDVLALKPDGIFLSNGPGDPEPLHYAQENIRKLAGRKPIFGICLGHQLIGLALGGKTYKLKFGHHGGNHPVQQTDTRQDRDHRAQPQLRHRSGFAEAERGRSDAHRPERQHARRPAPSLAAALQRAVPSRGESRAARLALPLPRLPQDDGGVEAVNARSYCLLAVAAAVLPAAGHAGRASVGLRHRSALGLPDKAAMSYVSRCLGRRRRVPSSYIRAAAGMSRKICASSFSERQGNMEGIAMVWKLKDLPRAVYQWNHDGEFNRDVVACLDSSGKVIRSESQYTPGESEPDQRWIYMHTLTTAGHHGNLQGSAASQTGRDIPEDGRI